VKERTTTVTLTARELVLVRVACIQRLDRLKDKNPVSYDETKALLNGKLWAAIADIRLNPPVKGERKKPQAT